MDQLPVHKAAPAADEQHCDVCGQYIKRVPGGQGPTWVHSDSGAVAAPNPPRHPSYTIQISGHLLGQEEVEQALADAVDRSTVIPDAVAKTIASWWHSPGTVGRVLSQLSHGIEFDTDELIEDIDKTIAQSNWSPGNRLELALLRNWAEHWTGDYRG